MTGRDGLRTTVCLPLELQRLAASRLGGAPAVASLVRTLFRHAPAAAASRSGWVQDRLREQLHRHLGDGGGESEAVD